MKFQQIRNATAIITYAGSRFLIDPLFAPKDYFDPIPECFTPDKRWPLVELPVPENEITRNLNAVIVTHSHIDHIDEFAAKALPKALKILFRMNMTKTLCIIWLYGCGNFKRNRHCF